MGCPKRWKHPHWRLAGPAAAMLAVTAALVVSGCSVATPASGSASTSVSITSGGRGASGSAPALTAAQARQAFDHYAAVTNAAARHSRPVFYLPEQAGYPKFFVAYSTRSAARTSTAGGRVAEVGGVRVPQDGPVLMLFTQDSADASWKLASVSSLPAGTTMPALARDASSNVPQVSLSAPGLLIPPRDAGALQAAVVDEGPANAASGDVAAGPLTTGMYRGALGPPRPLGLTVPAGDVYQWTLQGSTLPAFALRTADGGALVFYAMTLNTTVAVPDVISKADPIRPGPPIQVPVGVLALLPSGVPAAPREQLTAQQTLSFAAVDPPAGNGKLQVVAIGGGLTSASAS
jgi:hypothetical protein